MILPIASVLSQVHHGSAPVLGILGGTFDPIHNGHLRPAIEAAEQFGITQIALMPLNVAVHRPQPKASTKHRLAMCELAAQTHDLFTVDTREIERGGESYTVDTLEALRAEIGMQLPVCWLMGRDSYRGFVEWNGWERILQLANIIVMERPDVSEQAKTEQNLHHHQQDPEPLRAFHAQSLKMSDDTDSKVVAAGRIVFAQVTPQAISSTETREKLLRGAQCEHELPQNVRQYIHQHQLYQTG